MADLSPTANPASPVAALDFAGGTVVHISSGISALVAALMIGPRMGFLKEPLQPHNLTYTALGAAMLWFGWFGFNAGSELASDGLTSSAFAVTHFAAAAGGIAWATTEWFALGKPTVLGASSGARGWLGLHHTSCRIRTANARDRDGFDGWYLVLYRLLKTETWTWVR